MCCIPAKQTLFNTKIFVCYNAYVTQQITMLYSTSQAFLWQTHYIYLVFKNISVRASENLTPTSFNLWKSDTLNMAEGYDIQVDLMKIQCQKKS